GNGIKQLGNHFRRETEHAAAFLDGREVLRLPERHRIALAAHEALVARGRSLDNLNAKIGGLEPMERQQLSRRDRDRSGLVRQADKLAFEICEAVNAGLRDETVDRIIEFS